MSDINVIPVESINSSPICLLDENSFNISILRKEGLGVCICITSDRETFDSPTISFSCGSFRKTTRPSAQLNISHIGQKIINCYSLPLLGHYSIKYQSNIIEFKLERK